MNIVIFIIETKEQNEDYESIRKHKLMLICRNSDYFFTRIHFCSLFYPKSKKCVYFVNSEYLFPSTLKGV